ncbi:hypothetical protein Slala04_69970 [Streptomyces lavendulae subsp. lavendulae]|nr:hypothetical protein Slala04_69970 [Streptomyces lavendulae subsp. lavendulae]
MADRDAGLRLGGAALLLVHLIGCDPAAPLLALLCRPLPQEGDPVTLWRLDRRGRTMIGYRLDLDTVEARPSVLGGALIDVTITDPGDDRPTLAARAVWEIWSDGVAGPHPRRPVRAGGPVRRDAPLGRTARHRQERLVATRAVARAGRGHPRT